MEWTIIRFIREGLDGRVTGYREVTVPANSATAKNSTSLLRKPANRADFVRGAAATIDREMGFIGRQLLHGIAETHVLHHYISTIPFYHADEATAAIRPVMGKHYRSDTKDGLFGFLRAMWTTVRMCQWVEPSEKAEGPGKGVLFFRNHNGLGTKPIVMKKPE